MTSDDAPIYHSPRWGEVKLALKWSFGQRSRKGISYLSVIEAFGKAIDRHSHVIKESPELVFPLLFNQLQGQGEEQPAFADLLDKGKNAHKNPWLRLISAAAVQRSQVRTMRGEGNIVVSALSPDGRKIVSSGSGDFKGKFIPPVIRIWDAKTGRETAAVQNHLDDIIRGLMFTGDGRYFLSASAGKVTVRNIDTGEAVRDTDAGHLRMPLHLDRCMDPSRQKLAAAAPDGSVRITDIETGEEIAALPGHGSGTDCLAFSPDGRKVVTCGTTTSKPFFSTASEPRGTFLVWDIPNQKVRFRREAHGRGITRILLSPNEKYVLTQGNLDPSLKIWDTVGYEFLSDIIGHKDYAFSYVIFSPDGESVLTACLDEIRLWISATGEESRVFRGHKGHVKSCAFSPDGKRIVSASADRTVRVWDVSTGRCVAVLEGHTEPVKVCALDHDGGRVISGSEDGIVKIWDAGRGKILLTLPEDSDDILLCAFSRDDKSVFTSSSDGTCRMWDANTGKRITSVRAAAMSPEAEKVAFAEHNKLTVADIGREEGAAISFAAQGFVRRCSFEAEGNILLSIDYDHAVRLWEAETGNPISSLKIPDFEPRGWSLSRHGKFILLGGEERKMTSLIGQVKMWDVRSERELWSADLFPDRVNSCGFSPDGSRIIAEGCIDQHKTLVKLLDSESGSEVATLDGHLNEVSDFAFSPDGGKIATAGKDGLIFVWDGETGRMLGLSSGSRGPLSALTFSPDSRIIVSSCEEYYGETEYVISLWDEASLNRIAALIGHRSHIWSCGYSSDGKFILSSGADGEIKLWDASLAEREGIPDRHEKSVRACRYSFDGKWIVSGSDDASLKVWDSESGKSVFTLDGHEIQVLDCAFTPDGGSILSSNLQEFFVWDVAQRGKKIHLRSIRCRCFAISPDGRFMACGDHDQKHMELWDIRKYGRIKILETDQRINTCRFSPDGATVLIAGRDGTSIWDVGTELRVAALKEYRAEVPACAFSPSGREALAAGRDGNLYLWDTNTGVALVILRGHEGTVRACGFSPDGERAISGGADGTLRLWDLPAGKQLLGFKGLTGGISSCEFSPDGTRIVAGDNRGLVLIFRIVSAPTAKGNL